MEIDSWLEAALADARRRGLPDLTGLLEGLAAATRALRAAGTDPPGPVIAVTPAADASAGEAAGDLPRPVYPPRGVSQAGAPPPTIEAFGRLWREGAITSERATEACLDRIAAEDPRLNAFILVLANEALRDARAADRERAAGDDRGPLHGVPISIKDLFDVQGTPTTAASRVRIGHRAAADAAAVRRLREAGAIIVGKTNLHEFAFGTTNEDSAFGPSRHPRDPSRSPGGSSGGSAVSVAAGMALASLGTDTGGSIRIPAAACGLVGLKPAYGDVPVAGLVPLSVTLDHAGPLAATARDAWAVYEALLGRRAAAPPPVRPPQRLRVAALRRFFCDVLDTGVRTVFERSLDALRGAGVEIVEAEIAHAPLIAAVYLQIVLGEAGAYHAPALESIPERYTAAVRLRLEMARYVQAEDYVRALSFRSVLAAEVDAALAGRDALVLPSLPIPAPPLGTESMTIDGAAHPIRALMLRLTQLFNLTGHPAISLPCGTTREGLPCGLQLVGARAATDQLLGSALAVEGCLAAAGVNGTRQA
jgi:aspartyl-tRNA(Asn)/glutamyl-tRNA(Gln) amidotransferase subunit A